jgi:hypothetical protein
VTDSYHSPRAGITLLFNLSIRWALVANIVLQLLYLQERTLVPTEEKDGSAVPV